MADYHFIKYNLPPDPPRCKEVNGKLTCDLTSYDPPDHFPSTICSNQNLQVLKLFIDDLEIPEDIGNLHNLEHLVLCRSETDINLQPKATKIPITLKNLWKLEVLDLRNNPLKIFPFHLTELVNLEELYVSNCQLERLPHAFMRLQNLKTLDFSFNLFNDLPPSVMKLSNLCKLYLSNCQLSHLPDSFARFQKLDTLDLSNNLFRDLPPCVTKLSNLRMLYLSNGCLLSLCKDIKSLVNLEQLQLTNNELTSLPDGLFELVNLKKLYLDDNNLKSLPDKVGNLVNLEYLVLNQNKLTKIPETVGNLKELRYLNLRENMLSCLPESVTSLEQIKLLLVDNNPLQVPPVHVCNQGIQCVRNYFKAMKDTKNIHAKRLKVLVLGESEAGKTSLVEALMKSKSTEIDKVYGEFDVNLYHWKPDRNDDELELMVVDCPEKKWRSTAGWRSWRRNWMRYPHLPQGFDDDELEFMEATCQLSLFKDAMFILAVNLARYSYGRYYYNIGQWIYLVAAQIPRARILVVPTHIDECSNPGEIDFKSRNIVTSMKKQREEMASEIDEEIDEYVKRTRGHCIPLEKLAKILEQYREQKDNLPFISLQYKDTKDNLNDNLAMNITPVSNVGQLQGMSELRKELVRIARNKNLSPNIDINLPESWVNIEQTIKKFYTARCLLIVHVQKIVKYHGINVSESEFLSCVSYLHAIGELHYFKDTNVLINPYWPPLSDLAWLSRKRTLKKSDTVHSELKDDDDLDTSDEDSPPRSFSNNWSQCAKSEQDNCYKDIRTWANLFVKGNPSCIAAVPCHDESSGAETTPDIVVYLYMHTSGMWITDKFCEDAREIFSPYTVKFVDLEREPLGGSFWPQDHERKNDAEKMAKMQQGIVENLSLFKNRSNVTAVYPSYKISNGLETNDLCVAVAVLGKGKIPVGEEIFSESVNLDDECYKIDIVEGYFVPAGLEYSKEEYPSRIGAGIGVRGARGTGTLGAFVTDGTEKFVLSCHHVLCKPSEVEPDTDEQDGNEESTIIKLLRWELSDVDNRIQKLEKETRNTNSEEQRPENEGDLGSDKKPSGGMLSGELMPDKIPDEKPADSKSAGKSSDEEKSDKGKSGAQKLLSDDEQRDRFPTIESLKSKASELKNRLQQLYKNRDLVERKEDDLKKLRCKMSKIKGHVELQELIYKMEKLMEADKNGDRVQNEGKMRSQVRAPRRGEILIEQPSADDYVIQVIDLEERKEEKEEESSELDKEIEEIDMKLDALNLDLQSGRQSERKKISQLKERKRDIKNDKDTAEEKRQKHVDKLKKLREYKLPRCIATYDRTGFQGNYNSNPDGHFFVDAGFAKLSDNERDAIDSRTRKRKYDKMKYSNNVVPCSIMEKEAKNNTFWKWGRTTGVTKNAKFISMINVKYTEDELAKLGSPYGGFGHIWFGPVCESCTKFEPHFGNSKSVTNVCYKCEEDIPTNETKEDNWALNCFMLENPGEFAKEGDSGALVFDEKNGHAWAMVVGTFYRGIHCIAVTSSLDITLKALEEKFHKKLTLCIEEQKPKTNKVV